MTETALGSRLLCQLNFIPEYRKYRGLGILGTNPNFIKCLCMWQQSPIANLLVQSLLPYVQQGRLLEGNSAKDHTKDIFGIQT